MRISQFSAGLVACLLCVEATALQLGQVSASSRLGEPLNARVELFGALPADTDAIAFELRPDIAAPRGGTERAAVASITADFVSDARGYGHVALHSAVPLNEPALSFRLRMRTGSATAVRHYVLALPAPAPRVARRVAPPAAVVVPTLSAGATENFGPVQSGQSLWKIMKQTGLAGGDTQATIARIVADNPHAFVGGDANRLRVGVELTLPGAALSATTVEVSPAQPNIATPVPVQPPAAQLPVTAPAPVVPAVTIDTSTSQLTHTTDPATAGRPAAAADVAPGGRSTDPQTAARLEALAAKFAAIRARYDEQQRQAASPATPAAPAPAAVETTPAAVMAPAAASDPPALRPDAGPELAAVTAPRARDSGGWTAMSIVLAVAACVLLLMLLVKGTAVARRFLRDRRSHLHTTRADEVLRAEITRKAGKRLELEDQMRRRIEQQRDPPQKSEPGDTIERAVSGFEGASDDADIDEAENRIAHGFYAEAETLLKGVISKTPANHRAKLRLAEIYYLNERHDEFVELAGEIHRLHRSDVGDDNWQRIMRMGKIVAPERPPFSGPKAIEGES